MLKKIFAIALAIMVCLIFTACEVEEPETTEPTDETIELTKENISEYIAIRGEYKNGTYHKLLVYYTSTADLEIQAYGVASGTFDNVKITVKANLKDKEDFLGKWHLTNIDADSVTITFHMPSSGTYSSSYSIECDNCARKLSGSSELEIVAVSGTFKPSK